MIDIYHVARRCLSREEFHRTVSKISVSTAIFREGDKIKFFSDKIIQQSWELPRWKFHAMRGIIVLACDVFCNLQGWLG